MRFSRQSLSEMPVIGYLLRVGYSVLKLPAMWADLHRDVNNLHRTVLELKDTPGAIGKFNGMLTSGAVAEHSARLTDHAAQLQEQTHELEELTERIASLEEAWRSAAKAEQSEMEELRAQIRKQSGQIAMLMEENRARENAPERREPAAAVHAAAPIYLGGGRVLVQTEFGNPLICKSQDIQLTPALIYQRVWDPELTRFYQSHLKPGMTYLEIGANIGYFTVLAASLVGHHGHVHAFEPLAEAFTLLELNCRLNNYSYLCELTPKAVGEFDGIHTLHTFEHNFGSSTLSTLPEKLLAEFNEKPTAEPVSCTTLDSHYAGREITFDFIKMDAEGAEPLIFAGSSAFLERCTTPETIYAIEYNPQAILGLKRDPGDFIGHLLALGFQVGKRQLSGVLQPIRDPSELDEWCNCELVLSRNAGVLAGCR
ncbi:MAG TPA: FkbM family methyltransferase [Bryobacteraceae bacterium]|nr:FkbM family methyltransferase [Bryobacteraceae bacterium]